MIDKELTLEIHKNVVSELSPASHKLVVAVCDVCGEMRDLQFRQYRDTCKHCMPKLSEVRAKKSKSMIGKNIGPRTEETKHKISMSTSGEKNHNFGKPKSPETLEKMRAAATGRIHSEETKDKMSETRKGVPKTDETRTKMSSAKMEYHPHRGVPMTLEERIGQSCGHQKIAVDDWDGFVAGIRDHVLPIHMCTKINEWFPACEVTIFRGHWSCSSLPDYITTSGII